MQTITKHFIAATLLAWATGSSAQDAGEAQADPVEKAREMPVECNKPASFSPLFELSASGEVTATEATEALAEANEEAFLKCPRAFLQALKVQSRETQDGVLNSFGTRHPKAELGKELRKLKNDAQVGPLVRTQFGSFLE